MFSFYDQCKSLTEIRADDAKYGKCSGHVMRSCLNRLHKAFKNYFKRVKEGGSKSYLKARTRYAKECQRVRESEHGRIHRETTRIVRLSPNLAIEDLQIQNMTKNPKRLNEKG